MCVLCNILLARHDMHIFGSSLMVDDIEEAEEADDRLLLTVTFFVGGSTMAVAFDFLFRFSVLVAGGELSSIRLLFLDA